MDTTPWFASEAVVARARVKDYSIIIPVYYNEGSLDTLMASLQAEVITQNPGRTCEVIFVDDGSGDGSFAKLLQLRQRYAGIVRVIKLTRNFGQVSALYAGFGHATGRVIVAMSADGQDPPGLINQMLDAHFEGNYQIVLCARADREESAYRRLTSRFFYTLIRTLCFPNMPPGGFDYVAVSRRVVNVLLANREAHPFFQGQILWTGFRPKVIEYTRRRRTIGKSRWTLGKKITYLIDGVLSYSFLPIRLMSLLGMTCAVFGIAYAAVIIRRKFAGEIHVEGWAPLMVVTLVIGGIQLFMMGVIGEYLWRTLAQSRNRVAYVIDEVHD